MLSDIRKARPGGNHALVAALRTGQRTATWWGSGFDALGLDADPGAAITADQMAAVFGRLRYPDRGTNIGTVQSVEGDVVVVIKGGKLYNVPLSEIYRDASGKTRGLVTRLSRAEIKARGNVGASTANN